MGFTKFIRETSALCLTLLLCFPLLAGAAISTQQQGGAEAFAVDKKQFRTTLYQALPWLPEGKNLDAAQDEVFEVLRQKTGRETTLPQFPRDNLVLWQFQRYYPGGESDVDKVKPPKSLIVAERQHLYGLISEDLLVARELLQDQNPNQQRSGLHIADSVAVNLPYLLGDAVLKVKVTEAFVLPYLSVAVVEPSQNLSRTQLLKAVCGTYLIAGETTKYRDALLAFIVVASEADSLEEVNWARVKLADVLARTGDYAGAIAQLKMVPDSSSLSPARDRELPRLLKQADEANKDSKIEEKPKDVR